MVLNKIPGNIIKVYHVKVEKHTNIELKQKNNVIIQYLLFYYYFV